MIWRRRYTSPMRPSGSLRAAQGGLYAECNTAPYGGADRGRFRRLPDWHAHQQAVEAAQVAAGILRDAENAEGAESAARIRIPRRDFRTQSDRAVLAIVR